MDKLVLQAQLNTQDLLTKFALGEVFTISINTSFGNNYDSSVLEQLHQQWLESNFENFPEVEIRFASEINNANGAFSADTNKIYLSREFITKNNLETITNLLLEEYGHFIDRQINTSDAPGDEGNIFSRLVRGEELSNSQLQQLKNEEDRAVVMIDGEEIKILLTWVLVDKKHVP